MREEIRQEIEKGIILRCNEMENGERRYRIIGADQSAYIRTESDQSCWENSHYHNFCHERYIVQKGYIYICYFDNNELKVNKLQEGDTMVIKPHIVHNVYVTKGAVTHTVKYGICYEKDWNESLEMDSLVKTLTEEDLESRL